MPSWVSLSHSYADFPFFKLPETRPAHSRVQFLSQVLLSLLTGMVSSLDSHSVLEERKGKEGGATLKP